MENKFQIEIGECYCLTSDGIANRFMVKGWQNSDYIIETLDGKQISLKELTKGGLSSDYTLQKIECPKK